MEITEIFTAKAGKGNQGFDRCFKGTIRRGHDKDGNPKVWGKIPINDGIILADADNQQELGDKLDDMVLFVLRNELGDFGELNYNEI